MDAINGNIYLAVMAQIKSECPDIKWIDEDIDQLELHPDERPAVMLPCALLSIGAIQYEDLDENTQIGRGRLSVKYAEAQYIRPASPHSDTHIQKAIAYFNGEHTLNKALHGWSDGQWFTPLSRKSSVPGRKVPGLRIRIIDYEFSYTDDTAIDVFAAINKPDAIIDAGITTPPTS